MNEKMSRWLAGLDLDNLADEDALALLSQIEQAKGWAVRVLTREDTKTIIEGYSCAPLTDAEWRRFSRSDEWTGFGRISDSEWEDVCDAVLGVVRERPACDLCANTACDCEGEDGNNYERCGVTGEPISPRKVVRP